VENKENLIVSKCLSKAVWCAYSVFSCCCCYLVSTDEKK